MNPVYTIPTIPQNLDKQETIIQIADVLGHLTNVTEDLIKRIETRIKLSNTKLSELTDRIRTARDKVDRLTGAKHATQVFSSSKYPVGNNINRQYITVFNDSNPIEIERHKVRHKKFTPNDEPLDKLNVYHVKIRNKTKETIKGLGEIPHDVDCLNDLLLYNTGKNLYRNFVQVDVLESVKKQIRTEEKSKNLDIVAAPHSLSERTILPNSSKDYFYTPNLGEVPALDVPLDLPDLPGIADDLRYDIEVGPGIAPSVVVSTIPDLPTVEELTVDKTENEETRLPTPPPLPPPPPPPPPEEDVIEVKKPDVPEVNVELPQVIKETPIQSPKADDMRANLMEAIRNAGGLKKLKSTTNTETAKTAVPSNDLMADLHAKLSLRRKGISGMKNGVDSAMEKISAMIPPPVNVNSNATDDDDDEDWEE